VLIDSAEVAKLGGPTFVAWITRKDYAASHAKELTAFTKVTLDTYAHFRSKPDDYKRERRWRRRSPTSTARRPRRSSTRSTAPTTRLRTSRLPTPISARRPPTRSPRPPRSSKSRRRSTRAAELRGRRDDRLRQAASATQ